MASAFIAQAAPEFQEDRIYRGTNGVWYYVAVYKDSKSGDVFSLVWEGDAVDYDYYNGKKFPNYPKLVADKGDYGDSLVPLEVILKPEERDGSDLLLELEKGIRDYEDEIPPLEVILKPSGYGSDLLLQSNQDIQSTIINTYTGQVEGTTTNSAGNSTLSTGNLPAGNYSVLSIGNTGEAASNLFLITPDRTIFIGK